MCYLILSVGWCLGEGRGKGFNTGLVEGKQALQRVLMSSWVGGGGGGGGKILALLRAPDAI